LQAAQPADLQISYFEPDSKQEADQALDLDMTLSTALAASAEAQHCLTHTAHPALRGKEASLSAQLAVLCRPRARGQPPKTHITVDRAEKVAAWRKSLGRSSLEKRLAACVAAVPRKKGDKPAKPSLAVKPKLWKGKKSAKKTGHKAFLKKAASMKALTGVGEQPEDAAALALAAQGPLVGKTARLVNPALPALQWSRPQKVAKHWQASGLVELLPDCQRHPESSLYCLSGQEAAPMAAVLDCRRLTSAHTQAGLTAAGGELKLVQPGDLLESPELQAGLQELLCRAPGLKKGSLALFEPQTWQVALQAFEADSQGLDPELQPGLQSLTWAAETAEQPDSACLLLLPVHSQAPPRWTLLCLFRAAGSAKFAVQRVDSLPVESANGRLAAQSSLSLFAHWLAEHRLSDTVLPPCFTQPQADRRLELRPVVPGFFRAACQAAQMGRE